MTRVMCMLPHKTTTRSAVFTMDGETGRLTRQGGGANAGRAVPAGDQPKPAIPLRGASPGPGDIQPSHRSRHRRPDAHWQCLAARRRGLSGHRPPRQIPAGGLLSRRPRRGASDRGGRRPRRPTERMGPTAVGAHAIQTDPSNRFAFVPHIARLNDNVLEPPRERAGAQRDLSIPLR